MGSAPIWVQEGSLNQLKTKISSSKQHHAGSLSATGDFLSTIHGLGQGIVGLAYMHRTLYGSNLLLLMTIQCANTPSRARGCMLTGHRNAHAREARSLLFVRRPTGG